jgi:hypothetical protein
MTVLINVLTGIGFVLISLVAMQKAFERFEGTMDIGPHPDNRLHMDRERVRRAEYDLVARQKIQERWFGRSPPHWHSRLSAIPHRRNRS